MAYGSEPPCDFVVEVTRTPECKNIGMKVIQPAADYFEVHSFHDKGLIPRWNQTCSKETEVRIGDRIVAVNSKHSNVNWMMPELKSSLRLVLGVKRGPVDTTSIAPEGDVVTEAPVASAAEAAVTTEADLVDMKAAAGVPFPSMGGINANRDDQLVNIAIGEEQTHEPAVACYCHPFCTG